MSKKLQQKQARRQAEEARKAALKAAHRRNNLLTTGAAVLVGLLVVGGIVLQKRTQEETVNKDVGVAESEAGCTAVEEPEEQPADHIDPGTSHAPYSSTPPTSGPHFPTPADQGFYTSALPPEQVVHNLEHGFIVIWYNPNATQEVKDEIEAVVAQEPIATVATPFDGIEEPYDLVLTAWGATQSCERVSQAVVDEFRVSFQGKGPELIVPPYEPD